MKKAVILLLVVLLGTAVFSYHARVRWTPWGFVAFDGSALSPLTANAFLAVTGRQVATIDIVPSGDLQELANQCQSVANQIMQLFREKKADKIALHPNFIEGCPRVNVGLPAVMPFISFEEARVEERREEEKREEEERKKAKPVEIEEVPSENPQELAGQCQRLVGQIVQIKRENKGERVAIHPGFIEGCPRVSVGLPEVMEVVPHKALVKKLEEARRRAEEERQKAEEVARKAADTRAEEARRAEAGRQATLRALEQQRRAEEERRVTPVIITPQKPAPAVPEGVKRVVETPEEWVYDYFKFK